MALSPSSSSGGGGGGGTVNSVTAADTSIVVGGTATAPTVATATLDVIATVHAPVAAVPMNAEKITGLANGTAASDAAAFGQIPTALPPTALSVTNASVATAAAIAITKLGAGSGGQTMRNVGAVNTWLAPSTQAATPSSAATSSTTSVMGGLAVAFTPTFSGTIVVLFTCSAGNNVSADGGTTQLVFGTGTAPVAGAAPVGTAIGASCRVDSPGTLQIGLPIAGRLTGLTVGTAIWIDVQFKNAIGGQYTLFTPNVVVIEQ